MKMKPFTWTLFIGLLIILGWGNTQASELNTISGKTMGTFYTVKFISQQKISRALWKKEINLRLKEVNARLSMYNPDSDISRFNRQPTGQPFKLHHDFYTVLSRARNIHQLTKGAWDGTVKPLVDLWGFGVKKAMNEVPKPQIISMTLKKTGFQKLKFSTTQEGTPTLTATAPGLGLDLGSIAKGYGVDSLARLLDHAGFSNFLVEIGGELAGSGKNKKGHPWAIGISRPEKKISKQGLYRIIALNNMAIATSGDYRNYFTKNKKTYSHIIDPKTGYPVQNQVASASVIAGDCTFADGLATALMVMDIKASLDLVNRLDQVECLIVQKQGQGFKAFESKNFSSYEVRF